MTKTKEVSQENVQRRIDQFSGQQVVGREFVAVPQRAGGKTVTLTPLVPSSI
jgi:hypothetical protein